VRADTLRVSARGRSDHQIPGLTESTEYFCKPLLSAKKGSQDFIELVRSFEITGVRDALDHRQLGALDAVMGGDAENPPDRGNAPAVVPFSAQVRLMRSVGAPR